MTTAFELAEELVARFDLAQLRHELHVADINTHPDADDYEFWRRYSLAVEEAINLVKLAAPNPIPRPDHRRLRWRA